MYIYIYIDTYVYIYIICILYIYTCGNKRVVRMFTIIPLQSIAISRSFSIYISLCLYIYIYICMQLDPYYIVSNVPLWRPLKLWVASLWLLLSVPQCPRVRADCCWIALSTVSNVVSQWAIPSWRIPTTVTGTTHDIYIGISIYILLYT